ncbi:MAG: GIN domain-containing protein, partial [Nitrospira sp.]
LEGVGVSGATQVRLLGFDSSARLDLEASGASQVRGDVNSGETVMRVSGASTVEIEGTTGDLDAEASGASTVRLSNFTAQDAQVNASGASNITVNASGSVTGEASGASTIRYIGEPESVRVDTSGASNVQQQ